MSENEKDNKAAYAYYCKSRRDNGNEPISYLCWSRTIYNGQVEEMVKYGAVIYEE